MKIGITLGAAALALATGAGAADAFCGFYVSGSNTKLFNDATQVVLMRQGTRTVLSMQNDFRGPLEDFAMVVPVPVVLKESEVKTLPDHVFAHVESLGSPRLVEYWEQDPCPRPYEEDESVGRAYGGMAPTTSSMDKSMRSERQTVKIEAKFDVAEYKILILSATDSSGLQTWLKQNNYKIPDGAEPLLRPYVESGMKFFVAKVDPKKVKMVDNHAALSPLRFHYDSEEFALPIRLGMANSSGKQDLIVNIISADKRYEVANYKNVVIPTNFDVKDSIKTRFGEFYAALFDKTLEANPNAVVTEYAWTARPQYHCDPCPELDVNQADLMTLGGDIAGGKIAAGQFVLTRLHARYGKQDMKDDLRFKEAKPITGGREQWSRQGLEYGAVPSTENYFQARYAIRHWWTGKIACQNPQRGVWGGPPDGNIQPTIAASKLAFAPRGKLELAQVIKRDLWEIGFKKASATNPAPVPAPTNQKFAKPPANKTMGFGLGVLGGILVIAIVMYFARRRKA
ncbi:MAG: hypothetical protein H6Q90_6156 [Deltaproteobacteria bacterium]|nr:hypothetical protein [Deltaproteobacteria bacterium]